MAECGAGVRLLQVKYLHSINATFHYYCLIHDHYSHIHIPDQKFSVRSVHASVVGNSRVPVDSCHVVCCGLAGTECGGGEMSGAGYRRLVTGQGSRLTANIRFECNHWTLFGVKNLNI